MSQKCLAAVFTLLFACQAAWADRVEVTTPLGNFFIDLLENDAPATVANFLNYVNDGDYERSFIHRSVPGFVVQGGGFTFIDGQSASIPSDPPVTNEFRRSNVRGTVAMAKLGNDPDSATSQWFINLVDNSALLDASNGGFTVFGVVEGNGMRVVDAITAQSSIQNFGGAFSEFPALNYDRGSDLVDENFVFTSISVAPEDEFEISPGIASSWYNPQTDGQGWFIDVIEDAPGSLRLFVAWFTYDDEAPPSAEDLSFGSNQHRWFTASGPVSGASATMDIFRNASGQFNNPRTTASERVGTLTMTFQSCTEATLEYDFDVGDGGTGQVDVVNLTPDSVCE